jgi:hypothetical protein
MKFETAVKIEKRRRWGEEKKGHNIRFIQTHTHTFKEQICIPEHVSKQQTSTLNKIFFTVVCVSIDVRFLGLKKALYVALNNSFFFSLTVDHRSWNYWEQRFAIFPSNLIFALFFIKQLSASRRLVLSCFCSNDFYNIAAIMGWKFKILLQIGNAASTMKNFKREDTFKINKSFIS